MCKRYILGIKNSRHPRHLGAICSTFLRFAFSVERKREEIRHCIAKSSFKTVCIAIFYSKAVLSLLSLILHVP